MDMHLVTGLKGSFQLCISPNKLANGVLVACRKCWQCKANKVKDWAGRCIAESRTAVKSHAITLTYGRVDGEKDHLRSSVLTYSDVQAFFKRLRSNGYPLRYLVTGEYGTLNGRAHWHLIAFWQKKVPDFKSGMCFIDEWPHGHINVKPLSYEDVTYCVKYVVKDVDDEGAQAHFSLSKKPPLGDAFFREWADRHVENGVAPLSEIYWFDDCRTKNGHKREFFMQGVTRDNFCKYFIDKWNAVYPNTHLPNSEFIEEYQDKIARKENEAEAVLTIGKKDPNEIKRIGFPKSSPDGKAEIIVPKGQGLIRSFAYGDFWYWVPDERGEGVWLSGRDMQAKAQLQAQQRKLSENKKLL